ncbi:MAG: hypothetical protein IH610_00375 [Deltaproteobacteria bacterium]|nr:hypothetical protein [Deltaproteobacteria bacterium]
MMIGFRLGAASRTRFLLVIAMTLGLAASARAEGIFPVNDTGAGNWVFDQPSVVANGTVLHVAFVGDGTAGADASPNTRLYYAAVNGGADFTNKVTTRAQVLVTAPVAIDNGAAYTDARHPQIAIRTSTELVILFQARPGPGADYKLFRALVTLSNNAVTFQRVDKIVNASGNDFLTTALTDPSFALVTVDDTLRVAFSSYPSLVGAPYSDVYYARVGLDDARVVYDPILLTKPYPPSITASSPGVSPLPRLRLDGYNNSHIIWAANNSAGTPSPTGIYYAMVKTVPPSVVDDLAIGATQVLSGSSRWGFPNVFLTSTSNIWILAADEPPIGSTGMAGSVGISEISPYAVTHDGNPVNVNNLGSNTSFFLNPPGGSVLSSNFDAYHPEVVLDSQGRVHVAGYGFRGTPPLYQGTPGRYYVMSLGSTVTGSGTSSIFASMVTSPVSVGIGDVAFATQLPDDYTRPAFMHFNGKSVFFWSGPDSVVAGARNLYVTSTFSPTDPTSQSGCSVVHDPRRGEAGRIPGAVALLLPAIFLALRRAARKAFAR